MNEFIEALIKVLGTLLVLAGIVLMVYFYAKGNDHPH